MDRQADRAGLVGDRTRRGLANPPRRVRGEPVPPAVVEPLHCTHQARVPLLDQVQELEPVVHEALHDGHHQSKVRLHHTRTSRPSVRQRPPELAELLHELPSAHAHLSLERLQPRADFVQRRRPLARRTPSKKPRLL